MHYFLLIIAVAFEVVGTLLLPVTENFSRPWPTIAMMVCYGVAFYLLTLLLRVMPIGVVYALWSGLGVLAVTFLGFLLYRQALSIPVLIGLGLIVAGIILVNLYSPHHPAG